MSSSQNSSSLSESKRKRSFRRSRSWDPSSSNQSVGSRHSGRSSSSTSPITFPLPTEILERPLQLPMPMPRRLILGRSNSSTGSGRSRRRNSFTGTLGTAPLEQEQPWMEWVASGMEFFGCEAVGIHSSASKKNVVGRALVLQRKPEPMADENQDQVFIRLHEDFFEALLKEQLKRNSATPSAPEATDYPCQRDESFGSLASTISSQSSQTQATNTSASSTRTLKRRPKFPLPPRRPKVSPIEAYDSKFNPRSAPAELTTIVEKNDLKEPSYYIHPSCVMQKDKGKGEPLGSSISAEGREACLDKLRDKMGIVVQVSKEEQTTSMKRRPAKVSQHASTYTETRSLLEMRLGFLSMQYGLLLHWNKNHEIVFICLRKMCHDSFYNKIEKRLHRVEKHHQHFHKPPALPFVVRTSLGSEAICPHAVSGTEVVHVSQPAQHLEAAQLSIQVKSITGLSRFSRYTLSMTLEGHTEVAQLYFQDNHWEPRRSPMTWRLSSESGTRVEIRLFERIKTTTLKGHMTLDLSDFLNQPSAKALQQQLLTMPLLGLKRSQLMLEVSLESPYTQWLYQELSQYQLVGEDWDLPDAASLSSMSSSETQEDWIEWLTGLCC